MIVNNDPLNKSDPSGKIIDTVIDVGLIAYDVYKIATTGATVTNLAALGADAVGLVTPGATGLGLAVRAEKRAEQITTTAAKGVEKTASGGRVGDFPRAQKRDAKAESATTNGGQMACKDCAKPLENIKSEKGVPTPSNQAQVHHDPAIQHGGGQHSTPIVLCPDCHKKRHLNE